MEVSSGHSARIRDIEVLRAVAILLTMFGHSAELLYWGGTVVVWMAVSFSGGVDLFFCISGFVIARTLIGTVPDARQKGVSHFLRFAIPFWIRRIFRIWPAAFFWLIVGLLLSFYFNSYGSFGQKWINAKDALAAFLQIANLHYFNCITLKNGSCFNLFGIYWSLSLEEQFYMLFPFLLFALRQRKLAMVAIAGILLQFFLARPMWSLGWAIRSDTLLFGVFIAIAHSKQWFAGMEPTFLKSRLLAVPVFLLLVFLIGVIPYDMSTVTGLASDKPFIWFNTGILAAVCAVTVFIASFDKGYTLPEGLVKRVMLYIGSRSYALYLSHNIMFFTTREIFHHIYPGVTFDASYAPEFILVAAILSFSTAELCYRFLERPLRAMGRRKAACYAASAAARATALS